ncbi:ATP-binding protein [Sorangium cellulosum]|uniref:AAA+ ATPase domain-containing protein n=1 Tax=Sorangium cellulosum So0157-2 TaxID=1254432 RepID=S4Y6G0_SORCE|nr:ATP-binding protein [Sorangium cellulosum]AGP40434.1 hypothetical protein SCE1572_41580 [Sorangium cellulosum So0157-2]
MVATVLFISANPPGTKPLDIEREERTIKEELEIRAKYRDYIRVRNAPAARAMDFREHLIRELPTVVHFSGHGQRCCAMLRETDVGREARDLQPAATADASAGEPAPGRILVRGEGEGTEWVPTGPLVELFASLRGRIPTRCVVLNACFTEAQAKDIAEHIDFVVGTTGSIPDRAAIVFSKAFYWALGEGMSFAEAFELGKGAIGLESAGDPAILRCWCTKDNAEELHLIDLFHPYVELLSTRLADFKAFARSAESDLHGPIRLGEGPEDGLDLTGGDIVFLSGWSGRGKTTALLMLARRATRDDAQARIPIVLRAEAVDVTVPRAIFATLNQVTESFRSEADLIRWMNLRPTLLLIDDWHRAGDAARRTIAEFIATLRPAMMAVVIAGAPTIPPPATPGLQRIELGRYSVEERDAHIRDFFGSIWGTAHWVLEGLPDGLSELLREPVILNKYLRLVRRYAAGTRLPSNVPDLLDTLLEQLLQSRDANARLRLTELSALCTDLAQQGRRFGLAAVAESARRLGLAEGASASHAEDLEASGVLRRDGAGFEFEHEIWRRHFEAKALLEGGRWDSPPGIREWVAVTDRSALFELLPFACGLIRGADTQEALLDALLEKDLELYIRALPLRADIRARERVDIFAERSLRALHRGYVDLVERHFAAFKDSIEPWCFGDCEGQKAVLIGELHPPRLTYSFVLGSERADDVILAHDHRGGLALDAEATVDALLPFPVDPSSDASPMLGVTYNEGDRCVRGLDLARSLMRPGSTRLIAAELLINNIKEILKQKAIVTPWSMREYFGSTLIHADRQGGYDTWLRLTVAEAMRLASLSLEVAPLPQDENEPAFLNESELDAQNLRKIIAFGNCLVSYGLGESTVGDIVLPGPELVDGEWRYTVERRVKRVEAFYQATAETYRLLCDGLSDEVKSQIHFSQWPCRAVVEIEVLDDNESAGWEMYWEACESWGTPPIVHAVEGRSRLLSNYEQLMVHERRSCKRWRRRFMGVRAKGTRGAWALWSEAVTEEVCDMLLDDLIVIQRWLTNAT